MKRKYKQGDRVDSVAELLEHGCQHHHDHRKHLKELHFTYASFHASIASSQNFPSH